MRTAAIAMDAIAEALARRLRVDATPDGAHFIGEVCANHQQFDRVFYLLADDLSQDVLAWTIRYRIAAFLLKSQSEAERVAPPMICPARYAEHLSQATRLHEAQLEGSLDVDVVENFILSGYNLPGICQVEPGDTVLDFGAFNGNSSISLARRAGPDGVVHAFEPNPHTRNILQRNLDRMEIGNVRVEPFAVSDRPASLMFTDAGAASRIQPDGSITVEVVRIDDWVTTCAPARVDFMKFDIEGYELPALQGATATILHHRPKMAISVYHLHYDINRITLFLSRLCPWYKFFLRHYARHDGEIVLYCVP